MNALAQIGNSYDRKSLKTRDLRLQFKNGLLYKSFAQLAVENKSYVISIAANTSIVDSGSKTVGDAKPNQNSSTSCSKII